jgi:maltose/moltooligosaccharide transporter
MNENRIFSIGKTFLLGFGFLGVSAIWALYNAYVPIFLKNGFNLKSTVIGLIMTIDNIFAVILLPYLGSLSDRTRSRLGRRRPFILAGAPFAAFFLILIPFCNLYQNLALMMLVIVMMNLSMSIFRSPVIALMPDITPSKFRSQANGIINLMGGLGSLLVYFAGKPLYDRNVSFPFFAGAVLMIFSCILVVIFIKEDAVIQVSGESKISFIDSLKELSSNLKDVFYGEKSLLFILLAIFLWFVGFNAIETFFTSYTRYHLGMKESTGALILGFFSLSFMITAILSGYIGGIVGRKSTISLGLVVLTVILVVSLLLKNIYLLSGAFVIAGFGWAMINVNSLPMVLDMSMTVKAGGYTGLYYLFSQAANIVAPPLAGMFIDLFGYGSLMFFSPVLFVLAAVILQLVRRGETSPSGTVSAGPGGT